METLTEVQIMKAVDWWAERLKRPTFSGLSPEERERPENDAYQFGEILATLDCAKNRPSDLQIEKFKQTLAEELRAQHPMNLSVDYNPDSILSLALEKAGIRSSMNVLPWKTSMSFWQGKVRAACGYRTPFQEL